jgi:hypothetical protein
MTDRRQPKSDADMVAEQQQKWRENLAIREGQFKELDKRLATMPDVLDRPNADMPWSHEGIKCACGGEQFSVTRWITINGVKYRFEAKCLSCQRVGTWDWQHGGWMEPARSN